jgi:hypothetical protein
MTQNWQRGVAKIIAWCHWFLRRRQIAEAKAEWRREQIEHPDRVPSRELIERILGRKVRRTAGKPR